MHALCARVEPSNFIDFITPFYPLPLGTRRNVRESDAKSKSACFSVSGIRNFRFIIVIVDLFWGEREVSLFNCCPLYR